VEATECVNVKISNTFGVSENLDDDDDDDDDDDADINGAWKSIRERL
jgi:hypothetical protein